MNRQEIERLFPIETTRLLLRLATLDDATLIQTAKESYADVLRRWMSWSSDENMSLQGTIDYLEMANSDENTRCIAILVVDKETGAHVLSTGLDGEDDDFQIISTGWWLSAGHEGKGLAFEGMQGLINLCRQHAICQKIISSYYEGNDRSQKLMERLGFQHTNTKIKTHRCHLNGEMMDEIEYEMVI